MEVEGRTSSLLRNHVTARLMSVIAERDIALSDRNTALAEKKAAYAERNAAIAQRDIAFAERDAAIAERDAALAALVRRQVREANLLGRKRPHSVGTVSGPKFLQGVDMRENCSFAEELQAHAPHSGIMGLEAEPNGCDAQTGIWTRRKTAGPIHPIFGTKPARPLPKKSHFLNMKQQEQQQIVVTHDKHDEFEEGQIPEVEFVHGRLNDAAAVATPTPYCSCTGQNQQCYRWGTGGWQSACCTTLVSRYPLPMNPKKRGSRLAGRKMSAGAFEKLLEKLGSEGLSPIDLKEHWAKHGTNRYVTLR